jgi:carbonic anhydrase
MQKIVAGLLRFQRDIYPQKRDLFNELAAGQNPRALFITCGDSRIVPDLITQVNPGELFICRNVGNIVPPESDFSGGVSSTIEYSVSALKVRHIIICGHSDCGAMKAVLKPESVKDLPKTAGWLRNANAARMVVKENYPGLAGEELLEVLTKENVIAQLENLQTHSCVASRLARGDLSLYGWFYDIKTGAVSAFDSEAQDFVPIDGTTIPEATPKRRLLKRVAAGAAEEGPPGVPETGVVNWSEGWPQALVGAGE